MPRNDEHEEVYRVAWEALQAAAEELLPPELLRVESPMERAERSFQADSIADLFAGGILADLSDALDDAAQDQPKSRRTGAQWAAEVLRGTNT